VFSATGRTVFPLCVGHGVHVVLDRGGQTGAFVQDLAKRHLIPTGDVGQFVHDPVRAIHKSRQADSHAGDIAVITAQRLDQPHEFIDEIGGRGERLRVDEGAALDDRSAAHHRGFDARAAEVDADRCRGCGHGMPRRVKASAVKSIPETIPGRRKGNRQT
jgi:hypothetical protein